MKLAFKKPKVDTCRKCDVLSMKLNVCQNYVERKLIEEERNIHHREADDAYLKKQINKSLQ